MIVQRTEKSITDITKHEIIAKFIMEAKAASNASRIPSIIAISESVKRICPELEAAIGRTVSHLETFLHILDSNEEQFKEDLIKMRIEDAIVNFSKEASTLLPHPDLLQVVGSWNHHHEHKKPSKKVVFSAVLLEQVLKCLHEERVTPSEAKLIAVSLQEDKNFEKILQNAEAESETEADSEQFSFSMQSSQPNENVYSQEFMKSTQSEIANEILSDNENVNPDSLELGDESQVSKQLLREAPQIVHVEIHENPSLNLRTSSVSPFNKNHPVNMELPEKNNRNFERKTQLQPKSSVSKPSPKRNHCSNFRITERESHFLPDETYNGMQFAQSSGRESDSDEPSSLQMRVNSKYKNLNTKVIPNVDHSDSDTSDCEKNAEYRFLTPTIYKKDVNTKATKKSPKFIWLSDHESNDSSIVTTGGNSQANDPNWSARSRSQNHTVGNSMSQRPNKRVPQKKKAMVLSDSDSSDGDDQNIVNNNRTESDHSDVNSVSDIDGERPPKKRRVAKKLYRSPNVSINDFVLNIRKTNPITSNAVPVHRGTNTPSARKSITPTAQKKSSPRKNTVSQPQKKSVKRQKCKSCNKVYKTVIALRRHVFLNHTSVPQGESDSICDD